MLPSSLLERMTRTDGLRSWGLQSERRIAPRIPLRKRVHLHTLAGSVIQPKIDVWIKDINAYGIGILVPSSVNVHAIFILRIPTVAGLLAVTAMPGHTGRLVDVTLLCRVARVRQEGDSLALIGATFQRLLIPGTPITDRRSVRHYVWLDVENETPADPFDVCEPVLPSA